MSTTEGVRAPAESSPPALGWQRVQVAAVEPVTLAEQAQVAELADLRATVKAVRAHLGGEDIEAGVLRVLAAREVAEAERDELRAGRAEWYDRVNTEAQTLWRSAVAARDSAKREMCALGRKLEAVEAGREAAREGCRRLTVEIGEARRRIQTIEDVSRHEWAAVATTIGLDPATATAGEVRDAVVGLAADLEAQTRRADGLERIASRRPVVPGPRLPAPGPSILGPAIAQAAREVACDGCAAAIGEIADALGIEDAKPATVASVIKALVDDLDALGEQVAGPGAYDSAEVIEVLRKEVGKVAALQAELSEERAAAFALTEHVRKWAGDLAVNRAEQDAGAARAISRALRGDL